MAAPNLVCLHGLGRSSSDWDGVRPDLQKLGRVVTPDLPRDIDRAERIAAAATPNGAILVGHSFGAIIALRLAADSDRAIKGLVLSSSFFPPALNGRSVGATLADYAAHRVEFVRGLKDADRPPRGGRGGITGLGSLLRVGVRRTRFRAMTDAAKAPVLVVHARDDHYVPVDFAMGAVARRPAWEVAVLVGGGHYPHVRYPAQWLAAVNPWLQGRTSGSRL